MHKVFSASQIRDLDHYTIEHEPIRSIDLMERASRSFAEWFEENFSALKKTGVVCGTGNNGGDGLAIARILHSWGHPITVWVVRGSVSPSKDFQTNFERLKSENLSVNEISEMGNDSLFEECDILIDALFGSGLSRPAEGIYADVIRRLNETSATVVAVDMPSGLRADEPSGGEIVKADYTVSFQFPKLSFFLPQSFKFTGEWIVRDIGLHKEGIKAAESKLYYFSRKGIKRLHRPRRKFDHKGTFGHAMLVAGSYGKIGAAVLAAGAALRAGVGLLTVRVPACGYGILQTAVPEAMTLADSSEHILTNSPESDRYDAIGIGPGIGQAPETSRMFRSFLEKNEKPLVLDADALNLLAANRELLHLIPADSILTPHPKEFERLAGAWGDDFERLAKQRELAFRLKSVVVLKGAFTSIAAPDGTIYFNTTGNPGMATGGTGDVLTGILTGLRAQGYNSVETAMLGVYLQGTAGDIAARELGYDSLIASDLIASLPSAFRKLLA